jgi:hypothetical protein
MIRPSTGQDHTRRDFGVTHRLEAGKGGGAGRGDRMRGLPDEALHRPFESGPFRMAMDLVTVPEADWFEFDRRYLPDMEERRRLFEASHGAVFGAMPVSAAGRQEALDLIVGALIRHHPDWFSRDRAVLRNHLTGESWPMGSADPGSGNVARPGADVTANRLPPTAFGAGSYSQVDLLSPIDPLELAGRLVQEDLCLVQDSNEGPVFTAAVLCFPSRWRLMDKLGKPLAAVHGPVPLYVDKLSGAVDRFMRHLKPGHIVQRLNWSLLDDPALFQPGGKWRVDAAAEITAKNAGSRVFLRVERQTLRRLPVSEAVLFGIRVHVYPLDRVIDRPDRAAALADAVRALPAEIQHYKSLLPFRRSLLTWLDAIKLP